MGVYRTFQIPDPGEVLVQVAGEVAGLHPAAAVANEVQRVRRPDGTIVSSDVSAAKKSRHSPLRSLTGLLSFEQISLEVWAEHTFGMMQKRSAVREVKRIWRDQGLDAAVEWTLANAKRRPDLTGLEHLLRQNAANPSGHLESSFRELLAKDLRKWRR